MKYQISVVLRIRPFSPGELGEPERKLRAYRLHNSVIAIPESKFGEQNFKFDNIYNESATTADIFKEA